MDGRGGFGVEVAAEEAQARRGAVEEMKPLWDLRQAIKAYEAAVKAFDPSASEYGRMGNLRRWLMDHEGERLVDGESGLVAFVQGGGESWVYDSPLAIKERAPALWQRLWETGCFVVDAKRVVDAGELLVAADLEPFRRRQVRTPMLKIEKLAD